MGRPADAERFARDAALIARIAQGDVVALSALMRLYGVWLAESVYGVVHSLDLAQDVVQDVFMRLWDTRESLHIQSSVRAFLYRSVMNGALNVAKHERVHRTLAETLSAEAVVSAPVSENTGVLAVEHEEFRRAFNRALQQLAPRARDIFLMRAEQGMDYQEIAEAFGITVSTAYKQVYLATKQLEQLLEPWAGGRPGKKM